MSMAVSSAINLSIYPARPPKVLGLISHAIPQELAKTYSYIIVSIRGTTTGISEEKLNKIAYTATQQLAASLMAARSREIGENEEASQFERQSFNYSEQFSKLTKGTDLTTTGHATYSHNRLDPRLEMHLRLLEKVALEAQHNGFNGEELRNLSNEILECVFYASYQHRQHDLNALKNALEKIERVIREKSHPEEYRSLLSILIERDPHTALKVIPLGISTVHSKDANGQTPLHVACLQARPHGSIGSGAPVDLVKKLLEQRVDVNALSKESSPYSLSPLGACVSSTIQQSLGFAIASPEQCEIFDLLLAAGADPKLGDVHGDPILSTCIFHGLADWAHRLLPKSDLEAVGGFQRRAIHIATVRGKYDLVERMLQRKVDPNTFCRESAFVSGRSVTPAFIAVGNDHAEMLKLLVLAKANPFLRSINPFYGTRFPTYSKNEPLSAYMLAVDKRLTRCIDVICRFGPKPSPTDLEFDGVRDRFSADFRTTMTPGYRSLDTQLKTEYAKRAFVLKTPSSIRFFCNNEAFVPRLQAFYDKHFASRDFQGAASFCEPLWDMIQAHFKTNPEFGIFFLNEKDFGSSVAVIGDYNGDTENEIVLSINLHDPIEMLVTAFHEMTHKGADLLYPKYARCAPPSSSPFHEAVLKDLEHLKKCSSLGADVFHNLFDPIKRLYAEPLRPAEYLARITEGAVILAFRHGLKKEEVEKEMQMAIPNLFAFYTKEFLPACKKCL